MCRGADLLRGGLRVCSTTDRLRRDMRRRSNRCEQLWNVRPRLHRFVVLRGGRVRHLLGRDADSVQSGVYEHVERCP